MHATQLLECEANIGSPDRIKVSDDLSCGRLILAHNRLHTVPFGIIDRHWQWVTTLDLSNNNIENVDFVAYFDVLESLVLDHNRLTHHVQFPMTPKLETLWMNFNLIEDLDCFITRLRCSCLNIRFLSLMGNPGVPTLFEGSSFHNYALY
eukprot:maker-scaffold510_size151595-snap-gene-0.33 protein:Tk04751 transcript:maker-scaffold510_size151595-snap-gene-0.33-mRNA-1 annotation:"predicted protein"